MPTSANDKLLFVHIPKTGGAWVSEALKAAGVDLTPVSENPHPFLSELEPGERFTFAFVREPAAWYSSLWHYHRHYPQTDWELVNRYIDLDLEDFILAMGRRWPGYLTGLYTHFVGKPGAEINYIGRQETLADDLVTALRLAEQDFDENALRSYPQRNHETSKLSVPDDVAVFIAEKEHAIYERYYSANLVR